MRKNRYKSKVTEKRIGFSLFFTAIILVILIRHFLFTPIVVNGISMMPTLYDKNRMIANKVGYKLNGVERFDIVVFKVSENQDYIKRIIGLPGDHIEYKDDQLYINGEKYSESYLDDKKKEGIDEPLTYDFDIKTLPSTASEVVPEGHYFLLGDNRLNSEDSRTMGFVSADDIIGKASIVFWPLSEIRVVDKCKSDGGRG